MRGGRCCRNLVKFGVFRKDYLFFVFNFILILIFYVLLLVENKRIGSRLIKKVK